MSRSSRDARPSDATEVCESSRRRRRRARAFRERERERERTKETTRKRTIERRDATRCVVMVHVIIHQSPYSESPLSPLVPALGATTLVKRAHGFIRRPDLNLHEIRRVVRALWTRRRGFIDVFPRLLPSQNVVERLLRVFHALFHPARHLVRVRTRRASKSNAAAAPGTRRRRRRDLGSETRVVVRLALEREHVSARRAKREHARPTRGRRRRVMNE